MYSVHQTFDRGDPELLLSEINLLETALIDCSWGNEKLLGMALERRIIVYARGAY